MNVESLDIDKENIPSTGQNESRKTEADKLGVPSLRRCRGMAGCRVVYAFGGSRDQGRIRSKELMRSAYEACSRCFFVSLCVTPVVGCHMGHVMLSTLAFHTSRVFI